MPPRAEMVLVEDAEARRQVCTSLARKLNRIAKDLYVTTKAEVAVFTVSDQGRKYQYASPEPGVNGVVERYGYVLREHNLIAKLARDKDSLDLASKTLPDLVDLENQAMAALEAIEDEQERRLEN